MPSQSSALTVDQAARTKLLEWIKAHGTPQQVVKRCRLVLLLGEGQTALGAAAQVAVNRHTAELWRDRVRAQGIDALWSIKPGRGRKPRAELASKVVEATLHTKPRGQTHWSSRQMARTQGVHHSTVARIWQDHQLKAHRHKTFKLSRDAQYIRKLVDVVGVYLSPPENAIVLCVDEKSQIQVLDRTQPGLPLKRGRASSWTHDYVRHGTTTLFAALEVAKGKVTGECYSRHRHQEFLKFLRRLDDEYDSGEELHLILDNYGTHKHPKVERWLGRHPRFKLHFIPTSSSWLNMVERWFAELTNKAIRRGSFANVPDLVEAIAEFIEASNAKAKPFVWKATVEDLVAKYERCRKRLEEISPGSTSPRRRKKAAQMSSY